MSNGSLRVHIDRLDLDLRGVDPALAQAAVRLLGSALEARLSGVALRDRAAHGATADDHALASDLADHLADRVAGQLATQQLDAGVTPRASAKG